MATCAEKVWSVRVALSAAQPHVEEPHACFALRAACSVGTEAEDRAGEAREEHISSPLFRPFRDTTVEACGHGSTLSADVAGG